MSETSRVLGTATASAHPNLALVKYWGKRNRALNVPAMGSLSVTLAAFSTRTTVTFLEPGEPDRVVLNGKEADSGTSLRVCRFLDLVREEAGLRASCLVRTANDFPTAVGLASSASAFAALALAACEAAGLTPSPGDLSILARRGSGSAARSVFGGFVEMRTGTRADGLDTVAEVLAPPEHWDLRVVVVITDSRPKTRTSTEGMIHTADTSPYYQAWLDSHEADLTQARRAILDRDIEALGPVVEHSALKMHAAAMAARPGIIYWNGRTLDVIHLVQDLRRQGVPAYFTVDAGPQVKILTLPEHVDRVVREVSAIPGIVRVHQSGVGEGVKVLSKS